MLPDILFHLLLMCMWLKIELHNRIWVGNNPGEAYDLKIVLYKYWQVLMYLHNVKQLTSDVAVVPDKVSGHLAIPASSIVMEQVVYGFPFCL